MAQSPRDVLALCKDQGVKIVDFKFVDMPGTWQHFSIPIQDLNEDLFQDGIGFDGSSIRGFQKIHESDMLLIPDPASAFLDPFTEHPTLSLICDVQDPITRQDYDRDPRNIAKRAAAYLESSSSPIPANIAYFGPEAEFFIFDDVQFELSPNGSSYKVDSSEGIWNSGRSEEGGNLGYKIRYKEGYFPVPPADQYQDLRSEMLLTLHSVGVHAEVQHHEVGTAGQSEIDIRFGPLVQTADNIMKYKYVIKNVARRAGKSVTFMPKPLFGDNGSGMHTHMSLWKGDTNLFYDEKGYAGLSQNAIYYIGGLLKHAPSILAFAAPTINSYRRLVPGFEAPVNLMYSQRNRSACVRIPMYSKSPKAKRLEFRPPDPAANPYLAFSALLMAGLDGIRSRIEPPAPIDKDLYELEAEEKAKVRSTPGSLSEVLSALEADYEFLLQGGVFSKDFIDNYIAYKIEKEVDPARLRPSPMEYHLYYDV